MTGALLINVGTPEAPTAQKVGRYLREFLMDPRVIDVPYLLRWPLVNVMIVPRRAPASAALYQKIWLPEGSPLLVHTAALTEGVRARFGERMAVEMAMRYGEPSIAKAVENLRAKGVSSIRVLPLYPQYSLAATESAIDETQRIVRRMLPGVPLDFLPPFFDSSAYLDAAQQVSRPYLESAPYDLVLFSFHGLPERQVLRAKQNYRDQSFQTAEMLAKRLGIPKERFRVGFQSRLGGTPWIKPYSDDFYRELPKQGVKRLVVLCPSFVADCLETVEEVAIRGKEEFLRCGGESLRLVPSLNSSPVWIDAVAQLLDAAHHSKT